MKLITLTLIFFILSNSYCQDTKEIDLVISIDEKVPIGIQGLTIRMNLSNGNEIFLKPSYHPGSLTITEENLERIFSNEVNSIQLFFSIGKTVKRKYKYYNYDIALNKNWLNERFIILKIYNLDIRRNRKNNHQPYHESANFALIVDFGHYSIWY